MKHGEIYWTDLPDRGGREQRGRRPCIIWQDTDQFQLPTVLVIPLTTRPDALRFPATVEIAATPKNGLPSKSVALVFQLGACDVRRIRDRIGELDQSDLDVLRDMAKKLQKLN